jgi:hypothetical protein
LKNGHVLPDGLYSAGSRLVLHWAFGNLFEKLAKEINVTIFLLSSKMMNATTNSIADIRFKV